MLGKRSHAECLLGSCAECSVAQQKDARMGMSCRSFKPRSCAESLLRFLHGVLSPLHTGDWKPAIHQQEHACMPSAFCHAVTAGSHLNPCAVIMSVTHGTKGSHRILAAVGCPYHNKYCEDLRRRVLPSGRDIAHLKSKKEPISCEG